MKKGFIAGVLLMFALIGWWAAPRASVSMPQTSASPETVVRTYVYALNERSFGAAQALEVPGQFPASHWWDLQSPHFEHYKISRTGAAMTGHQAALYLSNPVLEKWHQVVTVDGQGDLFNFQGAGAQENNQPWSFTLVRQDNSHGWRILDQGQG